MKREPEQLELPLEHPKQENRIVYEDDEYLWKQHMREESEARERFGCLPVVLVLVVLWLLVVPVARWLCERFA